MQSRTFFLVLVAVVAIGAGWYLFRPERLFINDTVNEALPAGGPTTSASTMPVTLSMGRFHDGSHETNGVATIYRQPDDTRVLRLTDFHTSNGPDVHVYLVAAEDVMDNETVTKAGFVDLGSLKGNVGDQNYTVPDDVDLGTHRTVAIWCARFSVNFGAAPLEMVSEVASIFSTTKTSIQRTTSWPSIACWT